jgi:hypothetical protein
LDQKASLTDNKKAILSFNAAFKDQILLQKLLLDGLKVLRLRALTG